MKAKLQDVTVATDGFLCLQLRWEDGSVWTWINREKVQADLKAAKREEDKTGLNSTYQKIISIFTEINRLSQRKDALCGLWEEERRYDVDEKKDKVLTWPEYLDKKLGVLLRVVRLVVHVGPLVFKEPPLKELLGDIRRSRVAKRPLYQLTIR